MAKQTTAEKVEAMVCKAMYDLECELVAKFKIDSFDDTIDGAKFNKHLNKIIAMYTEAAEKELDKNAV